MTFLITLEQARERVDISSRIDTFNRYLINVQENSLLPIICKQTYEELIDQFSQGGETYLDSNYQELYNVIVPYLTYSVFERYLVGSKYISTAAGMRKAITEIDVESTQEEDANLRNQAKGDAAIHQNNIVNFLEENREKFPLWAESKCNCGNFNKLQSQFVLGKGLRRIGETKIKWT